MQAERVHAILQSVSRGDTASSEENELFISEETLKELVSASEYVKQSLLTLIEDDDKTYEQQSGSQQSCKTTWIILFMWKGITTNE